MRYKVENGAVYRATLENVGHEESWTFYWDGTESVAFYNNFAQGVYIPDWAEGPESNRAVTAWRQGGIEGLDRVAKRLGGDHFLCVGIDRGSDLYVMCHGEHDAEWRDEIEAVSAGEVYRFNVEKLDGEEWVHEDDCEEFYGESNAEDALAKAFPLDAFPAEMFVLGSD